MIVLDQEQLNLLKQDLEQKWKLPPERLREAIALRFADCFDFLFNPENTFLPKDVEIGLSSLREQEIKNFKHSCQHLAPHKDEEILFLVGEGIKGIEALFFARYLSEQNYKIRAFIFRPHSFQETTPSSSNLEFSDILSIATASGVKLSYFNNSEDLTQYFQHYQGPGPIVIEALSEGALSQTYFDLIQAVNEQARFIISINIPSGVCSSTGICTSTAIKANVTFSSFALQRGHFLGRGAKKAGLVLNTTAGTAMAIRELVPSDNCFHLLNHSWFYQRSKRSPFSHKNHFGHCLVLGGSKGLVGAALLAAQGALHVGCGLVTAATWEEHYQEMTMRMPAEIMTGIIPSDPSSAQKALDRLYRYDSLVIGPGLGRTQKTFELVASLLLNFQGPIILDADALHVFSFYDQISLLRKRVGPILVTPHYGEFAKMMKIPVETILENPIEHLRNFVRDLGINTILKGPATLLGFTSGEKAINYGPNSALGKGGSGDLLAGILGGLMAQLRISSSTDSSTQKQLSFVEQACLGVYLHSLTGKLASQHFGERALKISDLLDSLPLAFKHCQV